MPWWNNDWGYKQKLTLDTSTLSANVTNDHVIAVVIAAGNSDFWDNTEADGKDVRFTNAAEDTLLEYHFEQFNHTSDDMVAWIKVTDTFTSASDLEIYMYYGNSGAIDAQNISATYPSAYQAVWHLEEAGTFLDSTTNNNDETGSAVTREATGKLFKGASFNGTNQHVDFGTTIGDVGTGEFTFMIWVNTTTTGVHQHLMGARINASDITWSRMYINSAAGKIQFEFGSGATILSTTSIASTGWRMVTGTRRSAGACNIYIDATSEDSETVTASGTSDNNANFTIGATDDLDNDLTGILDEAKVFNYGLSADEVKLIFLSESGALITFGGQSVLPVVSSPWINKYW